MNGAWHKLRSEVVQYFHGCKDVIETVNRDALCLELQNENIEKVLERYVLLLENAEGGSGEKDDV
jgi:hypothetical protein